MSFLSKSGFADELVAAVNANPAFATQTQAFDGSILLEVDSDRLWLKVYRGRVIDHQDSIPVFGYTFKLSGPEAHWQKLISGERRWADLTFPGKRYFDDDPELSRVGEMTVDIATEGNLLEAARMTEAVFELAYAIRDVAAQS